MLGDRLTDKAYRLVRGFPPHREEFPMATSRRMGATDSKTRTLLLDVAEQMIIEEGYAAVSSRRVAAKAGLSAQLVHYYFRTMDDLLLEVYRRRADEGLAKFEQLVETKPSLKDLWDFNPTHTMFL